MNNSIKSLQLTHLKLSISEHQKREKSLNENYLRAKNDFCLCLETTEINIINKELELRFTKLLICEENKYKAKSFKTIFKCIELNLAKYFKEQNFS